MGEMPKLIAAYAFRDDADLVPDMLENLKGFVDDFVLWDDRKRTDLWYHEGSVRNRLIADAKAKGADWILGMDPDERFEKDAGPRIRELISRDGRIIYGFSFRELWTADSYRVDGVWGKKMKWALFSVHPGQTFMNQSLHSGWFPTDPGHQTIETGINLYHLKMLDKRNRELRRDLYNALDPDKKLQPIGYDYLVDERDIALERIPAGREFHPPVRGAYSWRGVGWRLLKKRLRRKFLA